MILSQTVSLKLLAAAMPVAGGGHREGVACALDLPVEYGA
jgi:hypothetical protein